MVDKTIFKTDWIEVLQTPLGFQYAQRKGVDSIGVFLVRSTGTNWEVLMRYQPLCVDNTEQTLYRCPVTGGLEPGESPFDCALREVYEETGYHLNPSNLHQLGDYIVGTQTNERVYLYYSNVTDLEPNEATQDGTIHEAMSKNVWEELDFLKYSEYSGCLIGYLLLVNVL